MGVEYDGSKTDNELSFTNRVRIIFTASGETDGGLSFGASVRADNATGGNAGNAGSVFISGAFGTISMGDVDDAFGALFGDLAGVGLTGLGDLNELSHSADGGAFSVGAQTFVVGGLFDPLAAFPFGVGNPLPAYNGLFSEGEVAGTWVADLDDLRGFLSDLEFQFGGQFDAAAAEAEIAPAGFEAGLVNPGFLTVGSSGDVMDEDADITYNTGLAGFEDALFEGFIVGADLPSDALDGIESFEYLPAFAITSTFNLAPIDARALYEYSMNGFSVALGYSQTGKAEAGSLALSYAIDNLTVAVGVAQAKWDDAAVFALTATGVDADHPTLADGFSPNFETITLVTQSHDAKADDWNVGVRYAIDSLTLAAVYQDRTFKLNGIEVDNQKTAGVSVGYTMDALSLTAFAKQTDSSAFAQKSRAYGIGAAYDLGGGASVVGGIVDSRGFTGSSKTTADLGVSFTF